VKDQPPCEFCGQVPFNVDTFWDDICEIFDDLKDSDMDNNYGRFCVYQERTRLKHDVLQRHDCRPLTMCIRSEIMDSWPEPTGTYVGLRSSN
jgi:hypothetical protein